MLRAHCNGTSIAESIGVAPDTLYLRVQQVYGMTFSAYAQIKKQEGQDALRLKQFQIAMEGDKTMLIWLGKQYLGQTERVESTMFLPEIKLETLNPAAAETIRETLEQLDDDN